MPPAGTLDGCQTSIQFLLSPLGLYLPPPRLYAYPLISFPFLSRLMKTEVISHKSVFKRFSVLFTSSIKIYRMLRILNCELRYKIFHNLAP